MTETMTDKDQLAMLIEEIHDRWATTTADPGEVKEHGADLAKRMMFVARLTTGDDAMSHSQLRITASAMGCIGIQAADDSDMLAERIARKLWVTDVAKREADMASGPFDAFLPVDDRSDLAFALRKLASYGSDSVVEATFRSKPDGRVVLTPESDPDAFDLAALGKEPAKASTALDDRTWVQGVVDPKGLHAVVLFTRGDFITFTDDATGETRQARRRVVLMWKACQDADETVQLVRSIGKYWATQDAEEDDVDLAALSVRTYDGPKFDTPTEVPMGDTTEYLAALDEGDDDQ